MVGLDTPDVQERGLEGANLLELTDIPADRSGRGWQPKVLHKEAASSAAKNAAADRAFGVAAQPAASKAVRMHSSHDPHVAGDCVFCWRCGGHTSERKSRLLEGPCQPKLAREAIARKLRSGLHPRTGQVLGVVAKWAG